MTSDDRQISRLLNNAEGSVERIVPSSGAHPSALEEEHRERYRWASKFTAGADRVLDVASGVAYGTPLLRAGGAHRVYSADIAWEALSYGQMHFGAVGAAAGGDRLPFPAGTFDAVVSLETIEHVPDPGAFLLELRRVVRNGGPFLLSTPNKGTSSGNNPHHLVEFSAEELEGLLIGAGFGVARRYGQQPLLTGRLWSLPVLRRAAWELRKSPRVRRDGRLPAAPLQFCWQCVAA